MWSLQLLGPQHRGLLPWGVHDLHRPAEGGGVCGGKHLRALHGWGSSLALYMDPKTPSATETPGGGAANTSSPLPSARSQPPNPRIRPVPALDSSSGGEFVSISGSDSPSSKEALLSDEEEGAPGPDEQVATSISQPSSGALRDRMAERHPEKEGSSNNSNADHRAECYSKEPSKSPLGSREEHGRGALRRTIRR